MSEKRFESRYNSRDGEYWLFDNKYDSCLLILNSDIQLHNLIILLNQMNEENEKLRQSVNYWQKKYEEGTETLEIGEQQATICKLQEEKEYWESKAMTLLMQVRRLTSRMTDKEVEEFKKELEE